MLTADLVRRATDETQIVKEFWIWNFRRPAAALRI